MTLLVATAACALMVILIALRPVAALLLYGMTATYADGFGVSQWLSEIAFFGPCMNVLFIVLFARAVFQLRGYAHRPNPIRWKALASLAVVAWCVLSMLMRGASLLGATSILPYLALPYLIIWAAFANASTSSRHLTRLVVLQSSLAALVLLIPGLSFLQGNSYVRWASGDLASVEQAVLYFPDASTLKGVSGNHYAQFHNPNLLGFYGTAAIAVGLFLLSHSPIKNKLGGLALMLVGVFIWVNSLTRGPMLGLLVMAAVFWIFLRARREKRKSALRRALNVLGIITAVAVLLASGTLRFLVPAAGDISVTGRVEGYSEAWRIIVQNPFLGKDASYEWDPLARPHFIGLLFAADYGVVAGIFIAWLIFVTAGIIAVRVGMNRRVPTPDAFLVSMAFGITAGIAATNNFAGPLLFGAILGHLVIMGGSEQFLSDGRSPLMPKESAFGSQFHRDHMVI